MNPQAAPAVTRAVDIAQKLQSRALELQTPAERKQQEELGRMLQTPSDKVTLVKLTDQAFRPRSAGRVANQINHVLEESGVPRFFSTLDRWLMKLFQVFGPLAPGMAVPFVRDYMRKETSNVVLPAETEDLKRHLRERSADGVRMNLNLLGEALLGETEAQHRLEKYLSALQLPEVEVVSVKISTIYSQINPLAREQTLQVLCDRLEKLFRAAALARFVRHDGTQVAKFVYLDMEEYRDLHLTTAAFMRTLDRPGMEQVRAGIALQAYIPDSARVQRTINEWARKRVASGGSPVTIRLVKGANMEMESVEASVRDWALVTYRRKVETDANYKRMLQEALVPENLAATFVGVASHNLFDLAYGLVLAAESNAGERVQFEMLEGMANHQRRALVEHTRNLLLYAPACRRDEFLYAIGYLIRRLDENTGPDNFLRHTFDLKPGSPQWKELEAGFRDAFAISVSDAPRRTQDRNTERFDSPREEMTLEAFYNEPDTDWSLPQNSVWAESIVGRKEGFDLKIQCVVAGAERQGAEGVCTDPSRPGMQVAAYPLGTEKDVERAVACGREDAAGWRKMAVDERNAILGKVAQELRKARGQLLWAALVNGGKTLAESDPEVSEAIDFVEFYRLTARNFYQLPGVQASPVGVVVVVPPWNFPIAIPCGGVAAALAAGNTVILKPASDTVLVAWELCQCFWRAGVPKTTLQFLPCPGGGAGSKLVADAGVDAVILTGGTETALRMLSAKPGMRLYAETGGKNATIISALSDRELAIKHVIHSAFSHSGQKCSATSLLLLESEVYDDPQFKRMLCDAVESMRVGSAWDLATRIGPCIRPPSGDLQNALTRLDPGEEWLVAPKQSVENPALWSPGVKYGVKPGSYSHRTEFFGPVLSVMRYETLEQAVGIVNATGYGLTSAIHSLDDREIAFWKNNVHAGNLYINRGTTGAVVLRQPFGGMGKSCFGPGMKAGGPNYVAQFMNFEAAGERMSGPATGPLSNPRLEALSRSLTRVSWSEAKNCAAELQAAMASYDRWWTEEFSREHDHFRLVGQDNMRRYLPFHSVHIWVSAADTAFEVLARVVAARATGAEANVCMPPDLPAQFEEVKRVILGWEETGGIDLLEMTETQLAEAIGDGSVERIRTAGPGRIGADILRGAAEHFVDVASKPVLQEGRLELLWYLREQSISYDYHRYGNLGKRSGEARRELL